MTSETIKLIIQASAVLIPSMITVLTLLKKKYYKESLKSIGQKIDVMTTSTSKQISIIQNDLKNHGSAVMLFLENKDIALKLRSITKHALQCCGNMITKKILVKFTQQLILFAREILDIGLQNTSKQQLLVKISVAADNTDFYAASLIGKQQVSKWKAISKPIVSQYLNVIYEIITDKMNSKSNRFTVKTLDLSHTIIKEFILFSANLTYKEYIEEK